MTSEIPVSRSTKKLPSHYVEAGTIQFRIFDISLLFPGLQEFWACQACGGSMPKPESSLKKFHWTDIFPAAIMRVIKPIYEYLTQPNLLERCLGGYTQNSNESFNQSIWKLIPKGRFRGRAALEIGVCIATCSFKDEKSGFLAIKTAFDVHHGASAVNWAKSEDDKRLFWCDRKAAECTYEARQARKKRNHLEDNSYSSGAH